MIRSLLIGALTGMRSMSPIAVVAAAARRDGSRSRLQAWLSSSNASAGLAAMALLEAAGDKWRAAPDRIIAPSIAARLITGGLAGGALAPPARRRLGALLGAAAAVGAAYLTFDLRRRAMRRYGQTVTGLVEDAITLIGARWVAR